MATFALFVTLLFQVVAPEELKCIGFIHDSLLPMDLYISGTEREGIQVLSTSGQLIYLSGKDTSSLKPGDIYWVVRPEGKIMNRLSEEIIGIYYKELGTVKIEVAEKESATASVLLSCDVMLKGDILVPQANKPPVKYAGRQSTRITPYPEGGLASSIILGKNDTQLLAAGDICFIGTGARDGVKLGDRFTIYRPHPPINPKDLAVAGKGRNLSYARVQDKSYENNLIDQLKERKLAPRVLGDLIVVEVAESTAAAKIVYSAEDVHLGDLVVRR
jgi:hypothetical protein